jgi:NADH-quinone oxidoreductase subunit M
VNALHFPWLELAALVPLIGAAAVSRVDSPRLARRWSLLLIGVTFACTLAAWIDFAWRGALEPGACSFVWPGGMRSYLTIDELSAPLLPLAALLYLLTAIATLRTKVRRFSFAWTLFSLAIVLSTLACSQPWGIIGLLAAAAVPPYLELRARNRPTRVYVMHMGLFLILMVVGWIVVTVQGPLRSPPLWAVAPLAAAILIRSGVAPFHCWVTDLFEHATFGAALLYVTPMMGAYAAVRLLVPIAPQWTLEGIGLIAAGSAIYAAALALVQREARRFFCYIFLSHSALVLVGLATASSIGLTGALCVWISIGLSLVGFGLVIRGLEARHGRLSLVGYHGVYDHTPLLAICFLLTGMASVGFPGTFGFLGTELLVDGAVQTRPVVGVAVVIAAALNGIAVLQAYFKLFTGTRYVAAVPLHIGLRERVAVLTLAALIIGGGLYPQPGVASRHHAAEEILRQRQTLSSRASPPPTTFTLTTP